MHFFKDEYRNKCYQKTEEKKRRKERKKEREKTLPLSNVSFLAEFIDVERF